MKQNNLMGIYKTSKIAFFVIVLICLSFFTTKAFAKEAEDFTIKKGVLTKYNGEDSIVAIPSNVTEIGVNAFRSNQKVTEVILHKNIKKINKRAFYNCKRLGIIKLPEGLQTIGEEAFYHCIGLKGIEFPKSIKSIGDSAFEKCKRMVSLTFPDKKITFGETAFTGIKRGNGGEFGEFVIANKELIQYIETAGNEKVTIPYGVTEINKNAFVFAGFIDKLVIPGSVKKIQADIFSAADIYSITLEEGVEEIEDGAFQNCDFLNELIVPLSVHKIGKDIFDVYNEGNITIYCIKNSEMDKYARKNNLLDIVYN